MQKWAELEVAHYHLKRKALTPVIKNGTVELLVLFLLQRLEIFVVGPVASHDLHVTVVARLCLRL